MDETRYAALARDLQRAIANGTHLPGELLPGEHELAERSGVSRSTVRAALHLLERRGLVERRRGAGTRVLPPRPPTGFGQSLSSVNELINYARDTRRIVRSTRDIVADTELAGALGVQPGSRWLRIRNLRVDPERPERPICATDTYVTARLEAVRHHLGEGTVAICDLLERHCGVTTESIEQEVQGALVPAALVPALAAEEGAPALRILRHYRDPAGWLFEVSDSLHPADRFAYRMRLHRAPPA